MIFGEKRRYILGIFLLLVSSFFVLAVTKENPGHTGDEILISINGYSMTLQEAISNGFLKENSAGTGKILAPSRNYVISIIGGYHNGNSIYVNLGGQKNIQEAIDGKISFCRGQNIFTNWIFSLGHSGNNVKVLFENQEKNFQDLIDSSKFCSYRWEYSNWNPLSCPTSCTYAIERTRTATCKRSDGVSVASSFCSGIAKESLTTSCSEIYTYSWKVHNTALCASPCKSGGGILPRTFTSYVYCTRCDGAIVEDRFCSLSAKSSSRCAC